VLSFGGQSTYLQLHSVSQLISQKRMPLSWAEQNMWICTYVLLSYIESTLGPWLLVSRTALNRLLPHFGILYKLARSW
jgi:hypothetical protein